MHDEADLERALAEIQEDCYEELYHIILASEQSDASRVGLKSVAENRDIEDVVPRETLLEISTVLPQSVSGLGSIEGLTEEVLMKYGDTILSITKDYHVMKRDVRLKHRMRKNISKHKLRVSSTSLKDPEQQVNAKSTAAAFSKAVKSVYDVESSTSSPNSKPEETKKVETLKPSLNFGRRMSHVGAVTTESLSPVTSLVVSTSSSLVVTSSINQVTVSSPSSTMRKSTTSDTSMTSSLSTSTTTAAAGNIPLTSFQNASSANLPQMSMAENSLIALKPRTIPTETVDDDVEVLDIVVGEVFNPSKIFIQKASEYDNLNVMMDELDIHYQKMLQMDNAKSTKERLEDITKEKISVGDYVAVTWTDNMWYRGIVQRLVDHQTLYVFYIDYGSHAEIKRHQMYLLDVKFFKFPAQAIAAELSAIEPVCDEAQNVNWSGYTTRRILELVRGCHLSSLLAIVTHRRGSKLGLWLMDHSEQGINETLVEEGFAKFVEDDENLNHLLTITSKKSEDKYNLSKVRTLDEEVLSESGKDLFKVRSLVHRSSKFYEQLNQQFE